MMYLFIFGRDGSTLVEYNIYLKITFVKGCAYYANVNNLRTENEKYELIINDVFIYFWT